MLCSIFFCACAVIEYNIRVTKLYLYTLIACPHVWLTKKLINCTLQKTKSLKKKYAPDQIFCLSPFFSPCSKTLHSPDSEDTRSVEMLTFNACSKHFSIQKAIIYSLSSEKLQSLSLDLVASWLVFAEVMYTQKDFFTAVFSLLYCL